MFVPYEITCQSEDSRFHATPLAGPAYASKVLMGVFPPGGSYTMEQDADGVRIYRSPDPATRTGDAGPVTPADINRMQAAFWAKRHAGG